MTRDWRILIIPGLTAILFITVFIWISSIQKPEEKPLDKQDIVEKDNDAETKTYWYVKFSVKEQKSTAYTEEAYAPKAANAGDYFISGGAVHPRYPLQSGGNALKAIIPFGTRIYLSEAVEIQGKEYNSLVINDTGDVNYGLWRNSPYWVDVYFGRSEYWNIKNARDYGVKSINYYWFEPWKE